jgi:hypothetical protein
MAWRRPAAPKAVETPEPRSMPFAPFGSVPWSVQTSAPAPSATVVPFVGHVGSVTAADVPAVVAL